MEMERYRTGFDGIHASDAFKARMTERMRSLDTSPMVRAPESGAEFRMGKKRKALLIVIAAVLLLLTACAAYTVYWSSVQRAKSDAAEQASLSQDTLTQKAEDYADAYLQALTLEAPLSGTASVGDVTISLCYAEVFQDVDGAEYVIHFAVDSDTIGFLTRFSDFWLEDDSAAQERLTQYESFCELGIDARDFVLTIDGVQYTPYCKPDYEGVQQPASGWNEPDETNGDTSALYFRQNANPITENAEMNLSGTLYSCDASGIRTGTIGEFSIDFTYRYPAEAAAEERQAAILQYEQSHAVSSEARVESLDTLPETATPVGLSQNAYTLTDVAVLEDGFLFGSTLDFQWQKLDGTVPDYGEISGLKIYLDGYLQKQELMDQSWELDTTQPKDDMGEYPAKSTASLTKVAFYRPAEEMPESVLVYITRERHVYNDTVKQVVAVDVLPLELVFYVNRTTGEVQLPKDDAEKAEWIAEQEALASDGRNDSREYAIRQEQTVNGMTMQLVWLQYLPEENQFAVTVFIPSITCEMMPEEIPPTVAIDGAVLSEPATDTYYLTVDPSLAEKREPYQVDPAEWAEMYDLSKKRYCRYDLWFSAPERITELPETFTLSLNWDIYDLNEQAEKTFIGTFHFEVPICRDGYTAFYEGDRVHEQEWYDELLAEYGLSYD